MPTVQANGIEMYYEVQGSGEPLVMIPYLAADQACYAFQVPAYAANHTVYTVDLRGAGLSSKPDGTYTTELTSSARTADLASPRTSYLATFGATRGATWRRRS